MNTGKLVRMNRIFSHASGRLCSVAVDHFIGYGEGLPPGLRHLAPTLAAIVAAQPDAVTMHKGIAASFWPQYAGRIPFILQSTATRPTDLVREQLADPADAVRLGADGFAVAAFVRGRDRGRVSAGGGRLRPPGRPVRDAGLLSHLSPRPERAARFRSRPRISPGPCVARSRWAWTW